MAKAKKTAPAKRLSVKKSSVGRPADPKRSRIVYRERPWNEPKVVPVGKPKITLIKGVVTSADGVPLPGVMVS